MRSLEIDSSAIKFLLLLPCWIISCSSHTNSSADSPTVTTNFGEAISGIATYYEATGAGNCSFPPSPDDLMVAAINAPQYNNASWCGACAEIEGALGKIIVRVVDQCPECGYGHLDLSPQAFAKIDDKVKGRVPITWQFVSCPTRGSMNFHYKDGSNKYWTALQVRNHRLPVSKLELLVSGTWVNVERSDYNYFIYDKAVADGSLKVRATAIDGSTREQSLTPPESDKLIEGDVQF